MLKFFILLQENFLYADVLLQNYFEVLFLTILESDPIHCVL